MLRLSAFFFVLNISSQNLTLNFENAPLKSVLKQIENQTDYVFYYDNTQINASQKVDINFSDTDLKSVLNKLLTSRNILYTISGNQILLKASQQKTIYGIVRDEFDMPIPGVTIVIKGTAIGTTTDFDGDFSINAAVGQSLIFTHVSMEPQQLLITQDTGKVNMIMTESLTSLNEIVLTGFGEETKKEVVTGAIESIDMDAVENSTTATIQESLQGNAAGVQVVASSGEAGGRPNVRIRGVGSVEAAGYPIYVVDGIILDPQEAAAISSSDVESISILKDAAATSIYGTKGSNGVILIKTKAGKDGKTEFKISLQTGIITPTTFGRIKPLTTPELSELVREGVINANLATNPEDADAYINASTSLKRNVNTDWYDAIIRDATFNTVNFSASGGSKKKRFRASLGYTDTESVIENTDFKRLFGKLNFSWDLTDKIEIHPSIFLSKRTYNQVQFGSGSLNPMRSLYRLRPDLAPDDENFEINQSNPFTIFKEYKNESTDHNVIAATDFVYKISKKFTFNSLISASLRFLNASEVLPSDAGVYKPYLTVSSENQTDTKLTFRSFLKYNNRFDKHNLNTFGGIELLSETDHNHNSVNERVLPGLEYSQGNFPSLATSSNYVANNISAFINAQYDYDNKYLLSGSLRRDGSSRFGADKRYGTFWSVGAGWNIYKEDFMDANVLFDQLKIRGSYGVNGQDRIGTYPSLGLFSAVTYGDDGLGVIVTQIPNPDLKWEVNKPLDIGLDFAVLDHKLSGTIDWYTRKTSDLIIDLPVSATNGKDEIKRNVGEVKNTGIEVSLSGKIINNAFKWTVSSTYTQNKNEVLAINVPGQGIDQIIFSRSRISPGAPLNTFYLVGYAGVDAQTGEALWYDDARKTSTTKNYSEATRFDQGNANPDFYGSITNKFSYKQFDFSFMFYTAWGGKVYDTAGRYLHNDGYNVLSTSTSNVARNYYENRWQQPGDNAQYPKFVYQNQQSGNPNQVSSRFLHDGSYIRLRDVTLSYKLPKDFLSKLNITGAKLYFKGMNVWTYVKDPYLLTDPEGGSNGELDQRVPISVSYTMGIDVRF